MFLFADMFNDDGHTTSEEDSDDDYPGYYYDHDYAAEPYHPASDLNYPHDLYGGYHPNPESWLYCEEEEEEEDTLPLPPALPDHDLQFPIDMDPEQPTP